MRLLGSEEAVQALPGVFPRFSDEPDSRPILRLWNQPVEVWGLVRIEPDLSDVGSGSWGWRNDGLQQGQCAVAIALDRPGHLAVTIQVSPALATGSRGNGCKARLRGLIESP